MLSKKAARIKKTHVGYLGQKENCPPRDATSHRERKKKTEEEEREMKVETLRDQYIHWGERKVLLFGGERVWEAASK